MIDVLVLSTKCDRATIVVREHGDRFTFLNHDDRPGTPTAVLMGCQCHGGHGVAGLPFKFWLTRDEARLDVTRSPVVVVDLPLHEPGHAFAA